MAVLKVVAIILLLLGLISRTPGIFNPKFVKHQARKFYYMNENIMKLWAIIDIILIVVLTYLLFNNSIIRVEEFVISGFIFMMLIKVSFLLTPNLYSSLLKEMLRISNMNIRIVAFIITILFLALIILILSL